MQIGSKIREARIKKGLSQEELAELSKVTIRTIQRMENNEVIPRDKTLRLVYGALDLEIMEEKSTSKHNGYLIWSSFLTVLLVLGTFLTWLKFFKEYLDGEATYRITNGWTGTTDVNGYNFENWLLSLSSISVGLIVIAHSLQLLGYKLKYIAVQAAITALYMMGIINYYGVAPFDFGPGLFIVVLTTVLLMMRFYRKGMLQRPSAP
jgi:transcriptional regulator with XRE-family HTH domain